MVVSLGFPPQGPRKELLGQEGKGSRPRMEENELYSSTTTGEVGGCLFSVGALPRAYWGGSAGWLTASGVFLPCGCPWPWPAPYQHRFRPGLWWGRLASMHVSSSPAVRSLLSRPCCWERAQPEGPGEGAALELSLVGTEQLTVKRMVFFPWIKVSWDKGAFG